jgi:hypothetical protein
MKNQVKILPRLVATPREKISSFILFILGITFMVSCQKQMPDKIANEMANQTGDTTMVSAAAAGVTYYIAPTGSDNNAGTITAPFKTLNKAWTLVAPGDIIYMRGGTYAFNVQQYLDGKSGTASSMISVLAYPGEKPVLTKGSPYTNDYYRGGCYFSGNYVHFKGLRITGFTQTDSYVWNGLLVMNSNNNIFEEMEVDNNGAGMYIQGSSTGNLVLNSDFHHNYDPISSGGNADGLDVAYVNAGTNNTVRGCRAWSNSDDGFDSFENLGYILFDGCWSWSNGYIPGTTTTTPNGNGVGFKLGTVGSGNSSTILRKLTDCVAFKNRLSGFHQEEGDCRMELYNNISFNNNEHGFLFDWLNRAHIFKNNIAFNNVENNVVTSANSVNTNNSYGGTGYGENWTNNVTAADFTSISYTGVDGARGANGSLPNITFLKLASGSDLIDAGVNIGLPFAGNAPDRGAFESGVTAPANQAPTANAGADKNVTLPTNTVSITGSGTDPDGTITAYAWTRVSGPNTPTLAGASTTTLSASGLISGTYVFRLTVTDNGGLTASDDVNVIVASGTPPPNQAPTANAGADKSVTLPTSTVTITGSGTDPDGTITAYAWTRVSGPNTPTLTGAATTTLTASGLIAGTYVYQLKVTDNGGLTATDQVNIVVTATTVNLPPVANAGADKIVTLPTTTVTIAGSATDPNGNNTITGYLWSKVSGPTGATLVNKTTLTLTVNGLKQGVYVFRLKVTDNGGLTATDDVTVTVNAGTITTYPINASTAVFDAGFAYYVVQNFGTAADNSTYPTQSTLRIYENGVELTLPHSTHSDIENIGQGHFSHWADGSFVALYFSASDNSNPKTNGRTYTYSIQ